jgi:hypothetical protein
VEPDNCKMKKGIPLVEALWKSCLPRRQTP